MQRTRATNWNPTDSSVVCSEHFNADCFEKFIICACNFGISKIMKLKAGAIQTIFERQTATPAGTDRKRPAVNSSVNIRSEKKRRSAFKKGERCRIRLAWQGKVMSSIVFLRMYWFRSYF